jgi:tetratricopeptide (TPR) repeat protein
MRIATFFPILGGFLLLGSAWGATMADVRKARDRQDRAALEKLCGEFAAVAQQKPNDADAQYQLALAQSYLAELSLELRQKNEAKSAAETGIKAAEKAVALKPTSAEYLRVLGTLCGQVIPANVLAGLRYGKCAQESVNKAVEMEPKSSDAWLSRGVGNYYLPAQFGGGVDLAVKDLQKAIQLNPSSADAYVWLGVALRKANRAADARKALAKALELNPERVWAKQLLEKTPGS